MQRVRVLGKGPRAGTLVNWEVLTRQWRVEFELKGEELVEPDKLLAELFPGAAADTVHAPRKTVEIVEWDMACRKWIAKQLVMQDWTADK